MRHQYVKTASWKGQLHERKHRGGSWMRCSCSHLSYNRDCKVKNAWCPESGITLQWIGLKVRSDQIPIKVNLAVAHERMMHDVEKQKIKKSCMRWNKNQHHKKILGMLLKARLGVLSGIKIHWESFFWFHSVYHHTCDLFMDLF